MPPPKTSSLQPEAAQLLPAAAQPGGDRALRQRILSWLHHHQQDSTKQPATAGLAATAVAKPAGTAAAAVADPAGPGAAISSELLSSAVQGPAGLDPSGSADVTAAAWPSFEYGGAGAAAGLSTGVLNTMCEPSSSKVLAVRNPGVSAKEKATRLWKKWKEALLPSKSTSRGRRATKKLSSAVLQQHQQAQHQQQASSQVTIVGLIPDVSGHLGPAPYASHKPATPSTSSETLSLLGIPEAAATAAAAGMPDNVVNAFSSRLYELTFSSSTTPANTPRPAATAGMKVEAADVSAAAASCSELHSSLHAGALAAAWSGGSTPSSGHSHQMQGSTGSAHLAPHTPGAENTAAAMAAACAIKEMKQAVVLAGDTGLTPASTSTSTSASFRQLSGTALTAYPTVAAALTKAGVGVGMSLPAGWGSIAGNSRQAGPATPRSAAPLPAQAMASAPAAAAAGGPCLDDEALCHWLLRAALLEDELQGRALEVREQLEGLGEAREMWQALRLRRDTSGGPGGGGEGLSGLSGPRCTTSAGGREGNITRDQLDQELSSITTASHRLAARAAALGSGISSLQGCQAVLCSRSSHSKTAKLTTQSKLAVLQLVLGDLLSRLPGEALWELEVLQGLPALDRAGQEMCRLAGAGSMAAAAAVGAGTEAAAAAAAAAAALGVGTAASHSVNADTGVYEASSRPVASQLQQMGSSRAHTPTTPVAAAAAFGAARCNLVGSLQAEQLMTASHGSGPYSPGHQQVEGANHRYGLAGSSSSDGGSDAADGGEASSVDDGDNDEVIATIESVLSSTLYTPRPSLAYESRRTSTAAAAPGQQDALQTSLDIQARQSRGRRGTSSSRWQQQQQQQQQYRDHMLSAATAKALLLAGPATDPVQAAFDAGMVSAPAAAVWPSAVHQVAASQASPGSAGGSWPEALEPVVPAPVASQAQECIAQVCVDDDDHFADWATSAPSQTQQCIAQVCVDDDHLDDWTTSPRSNSCSSASCVTALSTIAEVLEEEAAVADTSSPAAHQATGSQLDQQLAAPHYTSGAVTGDSGLAAAPAREASPAAADPSLVCAAAAEPTDSVSNSLPARLAKAQHGGAGPGGVAWASTVPSVSASQAEASGLQSVRLQQLLPAGDLNSMTVGQLLQALTMAVTQHQQRMQQEQ